MTQHEKARFEMFAFWRTSATYRVRVAMNLKNIRVDERFINMEVGEQRSEAFLQINPLGAIPAVIDLEANPPAPPLTQSLAILEFLDELHPHPALLPGTAHDRARIRSLSLMLAADSHPLITPRVIKYLTATGFDGQALKSWRTHWLTTGLQAFEQRLATEAETGVFCHGGHITMADICLASIKILLPIFNIEVPETPLVDRIFAACQAHEAFARAAPHRQQGAPG